MKETIAHGHQPPRQTQSIDEGGRGGGSNAATNQKHKTPCVAIDNAVFFSGNFRGKTATIRSRKNGGEITNAEEISREISEEISGAATFLDAQCRGETSFSPFQP